MQTLAELLVAPSLEEQRTLMLRSLSGIGRVTRKGYSPGTLAVEGTPTTAMQAVVEIVVAGNLGTATYRASPDDGATWTIPAAIPSSGRVTFDTTLTLVFAPGQAGSGVSFLAGERYSFTTTLVPFQATSWQPGSAALQLVEMDAEATTDVQRMVQRVAAGGFLDTADGPWLTLLSKFFYALDRLPGVFARGTVRLTDVAMGGPHSIQVGHWFASTSGRRFRATAAATLPAGGTVNVPVEAESPGAAWNVGAGAITRLVNPIPGVAVTNLANWLTQAGADEESDVALRRRCRARWPSLGTGAVAASYDLWARTASPEVTRTRATTHATIPGTVELVVAGDGGPISAGGMLAVAGYINPRVPLCTSLILSNAIPLSVPVTATLYVAAALRDVAETEATANLEQLARELPIGGTLYRSNIIEALSMPAGVRNVDVVAPAADVTPLPAEVVSFAIALTIVEV